MSKKKGKTGKGSFWESRTEHKDEAPKVVATTEGPLRLTTRGYRAVDLGVHACEDPNCMDCRHYPDGQHNDDPHHTPYTRSGMALRPGQRLRTGCDEVRCFYLSAMLTATDLEDGCIATVSFKDDALLREMRARSEVDGFHIMPIAIDVQSTGDSPAPISVQLLTSVPDPSELGVARTSVDKSWLAPNMASSHQLGQKDEYGNQTGHGYIIHAGSHHHPSAWHRCYGRKPDDRMRQAALTHYGQAAARLQANATVPLGRGPDGVPVLSDFFSWLVYDSHPKSDSADDELDTNVTLSHSHVKAAKLALVEHYARDDKRDYLMNLSEVRVQFDTFDGRAALQSMMSSPDPMLRGHVGVKFKILYIPLTQEALPRPVEVEVATVDDDEEEAEEEEEEEGEEDE